MRKLDKRFATDKQKHFLINDLYALSASYVIPQLWEGSHCWHFSGNDPCWGYRVFGCADSGEGVGTLHHLGWRAESLRRSVLLSLIKWSSAARGQRPQGLHEPFLNQYCTAVVKGTGFVSQFLSTFPLPAPPPRSVIS